MAPLVKSESTIDQHLPCHLQPYKCLMRQLLKQIYINIPRSPPPPLPAHIFNGKALRENVGGYSMKCLNHHMKGILIA